MDKNISLDYYKIFYEVAKSQSITKASNTLFISQPAITQTLKKLETVLGCKLFIRTTKGVKLTQIGERIFAKVEQGLKNFKEVELLSENEENLESGEIKISCGSNIAKKLLLKSIIEFNHLYPNVEIIIEDNVQKLSVERLKKGELDVLISQNNEEVSGVKFHHLKYEKYVFVTKHDDNDLNKAILMTDGTYSRTLFDRFKQNFNISFEHNTIVSGYNTAIELCKAGLGVMLIPYYLVEDLIANNTFKVVFEDKEIDDWQDYGFYTNENNLSMATKKFVELLIKNNK